MQRVDGNRRLVLEAVVHAVPKIMILQFLYYLVNMTVKCSMSLDKPFFPTKPRRISMIYGGSGNVRKESTASDNNEITEEIKQKSLHPGRILALLSVRCDNLKCTSIEDPCHFG